MIRCPACGRDVPQVLGAAEQACPHCGHEFALDAAPDAAKPRADPVAALVHALRFAKRHYGWVLVLWIPALLLDVGATLAVGAYERAQGLDVDVAAMSDAQRLSWLGVAAPILLLTIVLKLALFAPVGALVLDRSREGSRALRAIARMPVTLAALGLLLAVAYVVGALFALVGFVVLFHWYQYAPVALAQRRRGLGDAFEASRRFAKERRAQGFTALVLLVALAALLVGQGLEVGVDALLAAQGWSNAWTGALAGGVAFWLVTPMIAILPASFWALAAHEAPARTKAPVPRAASSTTRCPQCAALIPYEPTGTPVDVACPQCGRKGRVL